MAAIDPTTLKLLYVNDSTHKVALLRISRVTTGDTLDLSGHFSKIQVAAFFAVTAANIAASLPQISGTSIIFAAGGIASDAGILLVLGGDI